MGKYSQEIKQAVIDMYKDDMRVEDISDLMGVSESTIEDWAKQAGVAQKNCNAEKKTRRLQRLNGSSGLRQNGMKSAGCSGRALKNGEK